MKACVFQKQEPVNIPQIETRVLTDVLALPWGFEIYGLLTRWNPLNVRRPYPAPATTGKNVLVVGLGPAGYTLAHHLAREGFGVVGIDGLKIEPLPRRARRRRDGIAPAPDQGLRHALRASSTSASSSASAASASTASRFAGTRTSSRSSTSRSRGSQLHPHVRRRPLRRHAHARRRVGARLRPRRDRGGRGPADDHRHEEQPRPRHPQGERLPHGPAAHRRLQADRRSRTCRCSCPRSSSAAASPRSTPRPSSSRTTSCRSRRSQDAPRRISPPSKGAEAVRAMFDDEEWAPARSVQLASTRRALARGARARRAARAATPRLPAARSTAGAASRSSTASSLHRLARVPPEPRGGHEEPRRGRALRREPVADRGRCSTSAAHVKAMKFERQASKDGKWIATGEIVELPARTRVRRRRHEPQRDLREGVPGHASRSTAEGAVLPGATRPRVDERRASRSTPAPAARRRSSRATTKDGRDASRSTATTTRTTRAASSRRWRSAKDGYPARRRALPARSRDARRRAASPRATRSFRDALRAARRRAHGAASCEVEPPHADHRRGRRAARRSPARKFQPGQFYRLQNFETYAPVVDGTRLAMEGLALTGAWVDEEKGLLSTDRPRDGRLVAPLRGAQPASRVVLMGPTGTPTEIPHGETVLLAGGGLGNAVLFSIARALQGARRDASSTSPATRRARTSSSRTTSRRTPTRSSGAPTRAPRSRRAARRTRTSAATSSRRWSPTARASSARA